MGQNGMRQHGWNHLLAQVVYSSEKLLNYIKPFNILFYLFILTEDVFIDLRERERERH